jgi:uncharacterized protein involved in type VI secretion and phage assembly
MMFLGLLEEYIDERKPDKIYGVVTGIVRDIRDPLGQGRVKVDFPWLAEQADTVTMESEEDRAHSFWARIACLMAGKKRGSYFIPEVDDEVLVAFEHGDRSRPIVLGGLWTVRGKIASDLSSRAAAIVLNSTTTWKRTKRR